MESKCRFSITFKSNNDRPPSCWELQDFFNSINKVYMKNDLFNEIVDYINSGVKPENIIIINKSYDIKNKYKYLKDVNGYRLDSPKGVERLYNLGNLQSMYPNDLIIKIKVVFFTYEKLLTTFNKKRCFRGMMIPKKRLQSYLALDIDIVVEEIEKDIFDICKNISEDFLKEKKDLEKRIKKIFTESRKKINIYIADKNDIKKFKKMSSEKLRDLNESERTLYLDIENKYYKAFFESFKRNERPIILIYDEIKKFFYIVRKEYISNDYTSANFLDYKNYSHNSPFIIEIIGGTALLGIGVLAYKTMKQEKMNLEKDVELKEEKNSEIEELINYERNKNKNIEKVNDVFLKNKFKEENKKVEKGMREKLAQNAINEIIMN